MSDIVIVGGGAAGMATAVFGAEAGHRIRLYEGNDRLGKKLFITGKGRCNFTNACDLQELFANVVSNPKFLYSAFYGFTNKDAEDFFGRLGVPAKTERGNRVFPASDHSFDVILAMERKMRELGVQVFLNTRVKSLVRGGGPRIWGICLENGRKIPADHVILATGGCSYPATGSDGQGMRMAQECGLKLELPRPALVPLAVQEDYIPMLQGLSLKNVRLKIRDGKRVIYDEFGEMLFTHFGISGPLALSASSYVGRHLEKKKLSAEIDLKPALSPEQLDGRLWREFEEGKNKQFKNVIPSLFPAKLVPVMLALASVPAKKKVNEITREERRQFVHLMKSFPMTIVKTRGFDEAIITQGGVNVRHIDSSTMESKQMPGLYVVGEALDLDALTGGFNLQIAWSTAYAAGSHISYGDSSEGRF